MHSVQSRVEELLLSLISRSRRTVRAAGRRNGSPALSVDSAIPRATGNLHLCDGERGVKPAEGEGLTPCSPSLSHAVRWPDEGAIHTGIDLPETARDHDEPARDTRAGGVEVVRRTRSCRICAGG